MLISRLLPTSSTEQRMTDSLATEKDYSQLAVPKTSYAKHSKSGKFILYITPKKMLSKIRLINTRE